jgi:hypothetical protein
VVSRKSIDGILVERVFDVGTRAERHGYAVVDDVGTETPLHVIGDNPFDSKTLRPLLGKRVAASGSIRGRTLRVAPDSLQLLPAEAEPVPVPEPTATPAPAPVPGPAVTPATDAADGDETLMSALSGEPSEVP